MDGRVPDGCVGGRRCDGLLMRCFVRGGSRAVVWRGVDVEEGARPGQIGPKEWAVGVVVPSGAVRTAASAGRKNVVVLLAIGIEVASGTEGAVAAVGRERRRLRRNVGCCIWDGVDDVGVGDVEIGEDAVEQCSLRERLCSA